MSVAAWKRIAVGTKVSLVAEGRPHDSITGVVEDVTGTFLTIFGDPAGLRYARMSYRWPNIPAYVISDEPDRRLTWQNPGCSKITLTLVLAPQTDEDDYAAADGPDFSAYWDDTPVYAYRKGIA